MSRIQGTSEKDRKPTLDLVYAKAEELFQRHPRPHGEHAVRVLFLLGDLIRTDRLPYPVEAARWMDGLTAHELGSLSQQAMRQPPSDAEVRSDFAKWALVRNELASAERTISVITFRHRGGMRQEFITAPRDRFRSNLRSFDQVLNRIRHERRLSSGDIYALLGRYFLIEPWSLWVHYLTRRPA